MIDANEYKMEILRYAKPEPVRYKYNIKFSMCAAEFVFLFFISFKAGIANTLSSFKGRKIVIFMSKIHPQFGLMI